ncbi:52 kDa repressor of the inhibitor of the protein kinase, partial [Galemys pyrenaicus]
RAALRRTGGEGRACQEAGYDASNFCAAPNCTWKSKQSALAFRFLWDLGRCQKWVENCRRADLEDKTPDQLNKHYYVPNILRPLRSVLLVLTGKSFKIMQYQQYLISLALLEGRINSGEEVLRKHFETRAVSTLFCSKTQGKQMLEILAITGEEYLTALVRFVDESHNLREEFVGSLPYEADAEILAVYIVSSGFSSKMKIVASRLLREISSSYLHTLLFLCHKYVVAKSVSVTGVSVALGTIEEDCPFFSSITQLLLELGSIISVLFWSNEERGKELKAICHSQWTGRHDAVEIFRVKDFDFIVTIIVLKNVLSFTRAFGKNLQGQTSNVFFAASSLTAVLHSLSAMMEILKFIMNFGLRKSQIRRPNLIFKRNSLGNSTELSKIFSEQRLKALKCLSLVPSVTGQLKFNTSEEHHAATYRSDLPNPDMLSAELHCRRIKWKHRGKDIELPSTIYEALHLQTSSSFLIFLY